MIPFLGALYFRFVGATSRVVWLDRDVPRSLDRAGRGFIYAFWHAQQASLVYAHRDEPVCVLVSRSRDGQRIADALEQLGIRSARGSSSRGGGTALRRLLRYAEGGLHPAITPDGPRGPARKAKVGALYLAQRLAVPVVPIASAPRRRIVFRGAWDSFELPLPFNRIAIAHGVPVDIGPDDDLRTKARELEGSLNAATERARREAAGFGAGLWHLFYRLAFPALALGIGVRMLFSSRRTLLRGAWSELWERLGFYPPIPFGRSVLWFHAASVGEVKSLARLLPQVRSAAKRPFIVVTTSTSTGRAEAARLQGVDAAWLAPVDFSPLVRGVFARLRPAAYFLTETEIWPSTLDCASRNGTQIFVVNGRLSARSLKGYRLIRPVLREALGAMTRLCVQTEADRTRYLELGARPDRVRVVGNLKYDQPPSGVRPFAWDALGWPDSGPVWVAGSTHDGEESVLLEAYRALRKRRPDLRLVLAPRHVERAARVERLVSRAALKAARLSRPSGDDPDVLLADRMGRLLELYAGAAFTFVGGTLAPTGGHNLLEPASLGKPVLFGPSTRSVEEFAASLLESGGGARVDGAAALVREAGRWLKDPSCLDRAGKGARAACEPFEGATARTLEAVLPLLRS